MVRVRLVCPMINADHFCRDCLKDSWQAKAKEVPHNEALAAIIHKSLGLSDAYW